MSTLGGWLRDYADIGNLPDPPFFAISPDMKWNFEKLRDLEDWCNKAYALLEGSTNSCEGFEWQQVSSIRWVFGRKVRGVVRNPICEVVKWPIHYTWCIFERGNENHENYDTLQEAIEAVEKVLNIS